jgi:hypothetical protein
VPRGGARAGAGRKKHRVTDHAKAVKSVQTFREYWRSYFESQEGREWLMKRVQANDYILSKLIDKVYPSPMSMHYEDGAPKIQIYMGTNGSELAIPYVQRAVATSGGPPEGNGTVH